MKKPSKKAKKPSKKVESLSHPKAKRKNIPTAQHQPFMPAEQQKPKPVKYPRPRSNHSPAMREAIRNREEDSDPQLVWEGKDAGDPATLTANAQPLYIQEKVHPKTMMDELMAQSKSKRPPTQQSNLFGDEYNGLPAGAKTSYYQHEGNWQNRMILGDSLAVMASLAEREGLAEKVQTIYFDPPYGIKFNSNFQWTTQSRSVKDGEASQITREPEQVKAFRDTWKHGIHSYLQYIRDRLTIAHELLRNNGSLFLQIGDENVHLMRQLLDEVFGKHNFVSIITFAKTATATSKHLPGIADFILWYAKDKTEVKYNTLWAEKTFFGDKAYRKLEMEDGFRRNLTKEESLFVKPIPQNSRVYRISATSSTTGTESSRDPFEFEGQSYRPERTRGWSTTLLGLKRLSFSNRLVASTNNIGYVRYFEDFAVSPSNNVWHETMGAHDKNYIVQTSPKVIQRCVLMSSDEGDIVLDPTCGSGTTAYVAEQWGRRWIVIDTSRVALALARSRLMAAQFPYYKLQPKPQPKKKKKAKKAK